MKNKSDQILKALKRVEQHLNRIRRQALNFSELSAEATIFLRGRFVNFSLDNQSLTISLDGEQVQYPLSYYESQWLPMPGQEVTVTRSASGAPKRAFYREESAMENDEPITTTGSPLIRGFGRGGMSIPPAPTRLYRIKRYLYKTKQLRLIDGSRSEVTLSLPEEFSTYYQSRFVSGDPMLFRIIDIPPGQFFVPLDIPESSTNTKARVLEILTGRNP